MDAPKYTAFVFRLTYRPDAPDARTKLVGPDPKRQLPPRDETDHTALRTEAWLPASPTLLTPFADRQRRFPDVKGPAARSPAGASPQWRSPRGLYDALPSHGVPTQPAGWLPKRLQGPSDDASAAPMARPQPRGDGPAGGSLSPTHRSNPLPTAARALHGGRATPPEPSAAAGALTLAAGEPGREAQLARLLALPGAPINPLPGQNLPLNMACRHNPRPLASIRLLLRYGADCDARDANGDTPLLALAAGGAGPRPRPRPKRREATAECMAAMQLLLDVGADPNARTPEGSTAAHLACGAFNEPRTILQLLRRYDGCLTLLDGRDASLLHCLVDQIDPSLKGVAYLMEAGIAPGLRDCAGQGWTAVEVLARRAQETEAALRRQADDADLDADVEQRVALHGLHVDRLRALLTQAPAATGRPPPTARPAPIGSTKAWQLAS